MVEFVGIAPTSTVFQTVANLSQLEFRAQKRPISTDPRDGAGIEIRGSISRDL